MWGIFFTSYYFYTTPTIFTPYSFLGGGGSIAILGEDVNFNQGGAGEFFHSSTEETLTKKSLENCARV